MTYWKLYFRLYPGAIRSPQVVEFFGRLLDEIPGRLLIVLDRLASHRSRLVQAFVDQNRDRLQLEYLPAYAPELNPVEYVWGYTKNHRLANLCPHDFGELTLSARSAFRSVQRTPRLIAAFWQQAELF